MKVAILVSGFTRNMYNHWHNYTFPILSNLTDCEVTFFFQLWDNNIPNGILSENEPISIEQIKNDGFIVSPIYRHDIVPAVAGMFSHVSNKTEEDVVYADYFNFFSQPYSLNAGFDNIIAYEKSNDVSFDYILKVRYDTFFTEDFKDVIKNFQDSKGDMLFAGTGTWMGTEFSHSDDSKNILDNCLLDQWFVIRRSNKNDIIMKNMFKEICKHALEYKQLHNSKLISNIYPFEVCILNALMSLRTFIETKYYSYILIRSYQSVDEIYGNFINGIFPSYEHSETIKLFEEMVANHGTRKTGRQ